MKQVTAYLPQDDVAKLDLIAKHESGSRNQLIRYAVSELLERPVIVRRLATAREAKKAKP